jgi:threonine aldolase
MTVEQATRVSHSALRYDFTSDNAAGAMPEVLDALARANAGFAPAYGEDETCARAGDLIRGLLDADAEVWFAASGTAANALTLAALAQPHEAILAHEHSHAATDETGAPGFFGGGVGVIPLPGRSGRIEAGALAEVLGRPDHAHLQAPAALSLTNATEYGAVYRETDFAGLIGAARAAGVKIHVDGARLANAAAAGFDLTSLARNGVDVAVLGGTKAGATPTEAMVLLNADVRRRFGARLKHAGQLVSKARFLAAPWIGLLESGAWTRGAAHAHAMAQRLAALSPFEVVHPVEANAVFVAMDAAALGRLNAAGWAHYRFLDGSVRMMCSWATTPEAVDAFAAALKAVA